METSETIRFKNFLIRNLNYSTFSKMTFEEYQEFVFFVSNRLNELRNKGLVKEDIHELIRQIFSDESDFFEDILFERRFTSITEEIVEFCSDPFFWNTEFDLYMKKWEKAFTANDWLKDPLYTGLIR